MNRREREARTSLCLLAFVAAVLFLPWQAALIAVVWIIAVALIASVIYTWVTFDRHVDDAITLIRSEDELTHCDGCPRCAPLFSIGDNECTHGLVLCEDHRDLCTECVENRQDADLYEPWDAS